MPARMALKSAAAWRWCSARVPPATPPPPASTRLPNRRRLPHLTSLTSFGPSRCDKELARLQQQVDLKAERLRRQAAEEEGAFQSQLGAAAAGWEGARRASQGLEGRMDAVTQAATKVGNRLAAAERYRRRALEAVERITALQAFAHSR